MSSRGVLRPRKAPYTVSQIVSRLADLVESDFPVLLVAGEISNYTVSGAGHSYFVLKDSHSQLAAVMFRNSQRLLRFEPAEGDAVVVRGKLTVYPPRGSCQIQVLGMAPQGRGGFRVAYEKLKEKLAREGLFDQERKRPLPEFPRAIGVVTSPAGAAIRDILQVLRRRFQGTRVLLNPVRVQGEGAAGEIASAIAELGEIPEIEVIIVGRGGGSSEDLWAFNEESVARAIASSPVPVISAVGHETDWSISDLVADFRAPTPSAAAELVSGRQADLVGDISRNLLRCDRALERMVENYRMRVKMAGSSWALREPLRSVAQYRQNLDEMTGKLSRLVDGLLESRRARLSQAVARSSFARPEVRLVRLRALANDLLPRLDRSVSICCLRNRRRWESMGCRLEALNPLAVLGRGYALVMQARDGRVVMRARDCRPGDRLRIRLGEGEISAGVEGIFPGAGDFRGN